MKIALIIFLLVIFSFCKAQKFKSISRYEKRWSLFHPVAAIKVRAIYKKCLSLYEISKTNTGLDGFANGGKLDAYRHIFFMAAFCQKLKSKKIRSLGKAHEKGNYKQFLKNKKEIDEIPDSLSSVMDLFNNEVGIKIGKENKNTNLNELSELVISEIKKGNALYFKRNSKGEYLNCSDEIIKIKSYDCKWYIPKCLIDSAK